MQKYKYFIPLISIFLLLPNTIYADNCTLEELNEFKKIEQEYKVISNINKDTNRYDITLYNPNPSKFNYVIDSDYLKSKCTISKDSNSECHDVFPDAYNLHITGVTNTCDTTLKVIFVRLNPYNKYSEDPLCTGIEEFALCQETLDEEIDYDTFAYRVELYKQVKAEEAAKNKKETKLIDFDKITEYVEDNLFQIIIIAAFIIALIVTIILTIRSVKKSRRLE